MNQFPSVHSINDTTHIRYSIDRKNRIIFMESISGDIACKSTIEKELRRYIEQGYTIDCSSLSPEGTIVIQFMEILGVMAELSAGKEVHTKDFQTGLPVVDTIKTKILSPRVGILAM